MNLDFGILWIEDSYSHEEVESLKRRVQDSGFIAQIKNIPNSTAASPTGCGCRRRKNCSTP